MALTDGDNTIRMLSLLGKGPHLQEDNCITAPAWQSCNEASATLLWFLSGLDDENKELQQKLAALKVESRQKEAVNQTLAQELSDCRHSQQTQQLGEFGRRCSPWLPAFIPQNCTWLLSWRCV